MDDQKQIDVYYSILGGTLIIFILVIAVVLFFMIYHKRLFHQQILIEKKESDHRLDLLKNYIETTEVERKRIASDLHDDISSKLLSIRMMLQATKSIDEKERLNSIVDEAKAAIDESMTSIRGISYDLLPASLDEYGLYNTLTDLFERASVFSGVKISFSHDNTDEILSKEIQLALFRISQELLNNTFKYANAKNISTDVKKDNEQVFYSYSDDGNGFDLSILKKVKGLGSKNIESRVSVLGGSIERISEEGKGFEMKIILPLNINHHA